MDFAVLKLLFTTAVVLAGLAIGWLYLRKPPATKNPKARALIGDRPWRRVGGAICILLSVMFALGVYVVDVPDRPRVYAAYWTVMLGLVMWLMALAARDVMHTRKVVSEWHSLRRREGAPKGFSHNTEQEESER